MGVPIRGESWELAYAVEGTYGDDPGTASYTNTFGIVQNATLPDPEIEFQPFYGQSTSNVRNWYIAYKGRMNLAMSIPDILLLDGRPLRWPLGSVSTGAGPPYTHTISEATTLDSIAVHAKYVDADGNTELLRRFLGGKVNRATYTATEGGFLTMSMEEILFKNLSNNQTGENFYAAGVAETAGVYPTTEPYLFSYGSLQLAGTEFARVRDFRLSVDNACEAKYYVTNDAVNQLPYEHREGRRTYSMSVTTDIEDSSLYKELIRMGSYSAVYTGFQVILTFTRGSNDTITFTTPPSTPAVGGDAMGCLIRSAPHNIVSDPLVAVQLNILCRSLSVVVVDAIATYP